ncbi:unnamed protein product [Alternaria alternata]
MNHETRAALANLLIVALAAPAPAPAPAPAEPNKSINPDEAVSYGAAVQTAILSDPQKYVTVLNPIWLQAEAEAEGLKTKAKPDFRWFGWFRRRQ